MKIDARMINCLSTSLLGVGMAICAVVPVISQARAISITRVTVVNVVDGRVIPNSTVTIRDNTIASVSPNETPPEGAQVVNGEGKFLIPGLWDMHAHGTSTDWWLKLYVANGVTGIRDMGSDVADLDVILRHRAAITAGRLVGPRILFAGPILDNAPGDWPLRLRVKTADEGRAAVRLLKARGVDLIKVHDNTPLDAYSAIAEEARRQNLPLAGHVPRGLSVEDAVNAGQTGIEHLSNLSIWRPCSGGAEYKPEACRSFFEMLGRRGVWQTPTLAASAEVATVGTPASGLSAEQLSYADKATRDGWAMNQGLFGKDPELVRRMKAAAVTGAAVTRDMAEAGVGILAGCDMLIAGFCVHDELGAMVRGGMTPAAALRTATVNPAKYFSWEMNSGTVAPGRRADLVLLDANPLVDIANVRQIRAVVLAGRLLDRRQLDQLLAEAKIAASGQ